MEEANLREITKIDGRFDNLKDRINQIEDILDRNPDVLNEYKIASIKNTGESCRYGIEIEQMGTYLIGAKDIDSCREIEDSFYETERRYRQYAIGKNTFSIDFEDSTGTLSGIRYFDDYDLGEDVSSEHSTSIDTSKMDRLQIGKLIRMGIKEKDVSTSGLRDVMMDIYRYVLESINNEKYADIFNLMIKGMNDREISEETGVPRSTVNYRVGKIIDKVGCYSKKQFMN